MNIRDMSVRTPGEFEQKFSLGKVAPDQRVILGIDVGLACGYAIHYFDVRSPDKPVTPDLCGLWNLNVGQYDSGALRLHKLRQFLSVVKPDFVCVEGNPLSMTGMVQGKAFATSSMSSVCWLAAMRGIVAEWCEANEVPHTHVNAATIKKLATGSGNANKSKMIEAANEQFGLGLSDEKGYDNIADAVFVLIAGFEDYRGSFLGAAPAPAATPTPQQKHRKILRRKKPKEE